MKSQLLFALFGLTGIGASGQLFVPGAHPPPGAIHLPPPAAVRLPPPQPAASPAPLLPASEPALEAPVLRTSTPAEPPPDRMLITGGAQLYNERIEPTPEIAAPAWVDNVGSADVPPWSETFTSPWQRGRGVKFRLHFHGAAGVTWFKQGMFFLARGGQRVSECGVTAPDTTQLTGTYPIYRRGERVSFTLEIRNTTRRPLRDVRVSTRQTELDLSGNALGELAGQRVSAYFEELQPGRTALRRMTITLARGGDHRVSFQQTEVVIRSEGKTLANVERAAVIDPPATF